ncbi:MAG: 2-acyl-glycerophospho-ethanolamine acyltransferase [Chlamydiae bacterium CG10_big_fil_rev_8_21_14_0_10_42_34]|nr:MAG: 2-acyl-glycerophospho-ethanolamine acyltransferase [Chlamydiae bacterium CG10_big_fil_rev_8_21_14_0_10_42_34]
MSYFFWLIITYLVRGVLSLRYRIEVKGLDTLTPERLNRKGGVLFLPNHPALMDPLIVSAWLWPKYRMRPMIIEYMFNQKILQFFNGIIRGIPIPNFESGVNEWKLKRGQEGILTIADGLKKGDNFLLYPSGQLKASGKELIGGSSATHELLEECKDANVVLIRTTGLWGSSFSRALLGRSPSLSKTLIEGAKTLLKNLIFFAPRRRVLIEIEPNPQDLPRGGATRIELNRYLENWYDRYPDEQGNISEKEPVTLVSYSFWKKDLPVAFKAPDKRNNGEIKVPEEVKTKVYREIRRILERPELEIQLDTNLAFDLGMDSLNIAEFIAFLTKNFDIGQLHPEEIETVGDVFQIIEQGKEGRAPIREPVTFTFPEEKNRPAPAPPIGRILPEAFLNSCQRLNGFSACGDDLLGVLSYRKVKKAILVLAQYFKGWKEDRVAVMLPSSAGAYIVILALQMAGKTPVMLNWTLGPRYLEEMMKISKATRIVSSWKFLDRLAFVQFGKCVDQFVLLEDIRKQLTLSMKLRGVFLCMCSVKQVIRSMGLNRVDENDPCVILFTSGTESVPKGVPLSHKNIISNHRDALQCMVFNETDACYGVLPPFHSFGFSVAGLLPFFAGLKIAFYPDPTDSFALAEGINRWKITLFISPPSFLKRLFQAAKIEQLQSVRYFVSGAEKAPEELFERVRSLNTGAKLIEGYGITECAPMISLTRLNLPPVGVGRLLPDIEMITIHPETLELLPSGSDGELCFRGPNVFNGYLDNPRSPFIEIEGKKWYRTGDLGYLDSDGNLIISGRLKRFTKLGGEMISLGAIEETLAKQLIQDGRISADEPSIAICADEKEVGKASLILFATISIQVEEVNRILQQAGFSNLVKISSVKQIEEIPILGAGKTDYRTLQGLC